MAESKEKNEKNVLALVPKKENIFTKIKAFFRRNKNSSKE